MRKYREDLLMEWARPGVYVVELKIGNEPGRIYVGSSYNVRTRFMEHLKAFRKGKNIRALQNAYDEYGEAKFNFYMLHECDESDLPHCEKYWIERIQPEFNKNSNTDVDRFSWRLQDDEYDDRWEDPYASLFAPEPSMEPEVLGTKKYSILINAYDYYSPEEIYQGTYIFD